MKLANWMEKTTVAEFVLNDGTVISINVPESQHKLEYLDDDSEQVGFITKVISGRRKGEKALLIVPYTSIRSVTIVG